MGERLAAVRAKGIEKQEWQRYYNQHQQTYKRNKLQAVELAVAHTGSLRSLGCSNTSLVSWLDFYLSKGLKDLVADIRHQKPERLNQEQKQQLQAIPSLLTLVGMATCGQPSR